MEIVRGLATIVVCPDILVTDYIAVAGPGATLVNGGLVGLVSVCILVCFRHRPNGYTIMTLWLIVGFSFFGKNPVNILPILFGGFLYSAYMRKPFRKNVLATLLGTTLSPAVSQMSYIGLSNTIDGQILGLALGILHRLHHHADCGKLHQIP